MVDSDAQSRSRVARDAAAALRAAHPEAYPAVMGFDGFVDDIADVVQVRRAADSYDRTEAIPHLAQRIAAAAGQSANLEIVVRQQKLGGNGPIMANALSAVGMPVTYIGTTGLPAPHPVFNEFAARAQLLPLADPAHTTALEFADGKIMLGNLAPLSLVTWPRLLERVGLERLTALCDAASLIAAVNWTMLPHLSDIWQHLLSDVLPRLSKKPRLFFVDLADPEKRRPDDLLAALQILGKINAFVPVILGLNLSEALQIQKAFLGSALEIVNLADTAAAFCSGFGLDTVVIHPRKGAAAACGDRVASFEGPFVQHPKISTGAGDHFNAGFVLARLLGLPLDQALATATATSGFYVRTAQSPTRSELADFLDDLPASE